MHVGVRMTVGPAVATASAGLAIGAAMALAAGLSGTLWASAPVPALLSAAMTVAVICVVPTRGTRWGFTTLGLGISAFMAALPTMVAPGANLELVTTLAPYLSGMGAGLACAFAAPALVRFSAPGCLAAAFGWAVTLVGPPAVGGALLTLGVVIAARVEPGLRNLGLRRPMISVVSTLLCAVLAGAAAALFLVLRPAHGPVPSSVILLVSGAVIATAGPRSRWLAVAGIGVAGAAAGTALTGSGWLPPWALFFALGAAPALCARAMGLGVEACFLPVVALLVALPVVQVMPKNWQALGARAEVALPADGALRDRIATLRSGAPLRTSWGWWGASQAWGSPGIGLVELDGSVAGSSGRARSAERLGGTLAGCAVSGAARGPAGRSARVTGDDFGRVVVSLREQGFGRIDVAMPDSALADVLATADDGARRAWLSTEARLLRVPPLALLRARGQVDAVVEVVRVGWRDGRTAWSGAWHMEAAAKHVADGGAHVLVLPGVGVEGSVLAGAVRHFGEVWPVVGVFAAPQGAEHLVLVGSRLAIPWSGVERCHVAATWLRGDGVASALDLASLALADHHLARATESHEEPGVGLPSEPALLPVAGLLSGAKESEHVFGGDVPAALAERQTTRRSAMAVLLAGAGGDVRAAVERARELADQPGAGAALDPVIAPMLDRARAAATAARAEGADSSRWAEVDASIEAALLMNPASAAARCLRGDIAMLRRRVDEAARWYGECADREPESAAPWEGLARARLIQGDDAGAEAAFRTGVGIAPTSWPAALNLGVFLRGHGQIEEAETWLRRAEDRSAASTEPGRTRPHLALAMLYLETSRPLLALAEARRAEVDESTADSAYWTAAAQYELQAWSESEAGFRLALARRSGFVEAQNGLGLCLARRHDYGGAASAFRDVLARDPKNSVAREKLDLLRPILGREEAGVPVPPQQER